jgi:hypothetical protein
MLSNENISNNAIPLNVKNIQQKPCLLMQGIQTADFNKFSLITAIILFKSSCGVLIQMFG